MPKPTLQQLAEYPLVTYVFSFTGPSSLHQQFARAGLEPNVSLTARDADVIKTYVRLGLGVGVVASMAIEPEDEKDLAVVEAGHLFPQHVTWIGFRAGALLRGFTYDFIQLLAPHLTRERIERILVRAHAGGAREAALRHRSSALRLSRGFPPDYLGFPAVVVAAKIGGLAIELDAVMAQLVLTSRAHVVEAHAVFAVLVHPR